MFYTHLLCVAIGTGPSTPVSAGERPDEPHGPTAPSDKPLLLLFDLNESLALRENTTDNPITDAKMECSGRVGPPSRRRRLFVRPGASNLLQVSECVSVWVGVCVGGDCAT